MKKNLVPLLGIAFVVAILSTAIFYGLVASKMTQVQAKAVPLSSPPASDPTPGFSSPVPPGMRAVSVQVADSSGVLALLKPGQRVDIQAVYNRTGNPVEAELKTVLQNIEVLTAGSTPEASPGRHTLPVVTFLTTPAESDVLALADSAARIRLALRNPEDQEKTTRGGLTIASLVRASARTGPGAISPLSALNNSPTPACLPQPSALRSIP